MRRFRAAYDGADAVVLQLALVYDERALQMGENAARAAEAAGVPHLVINTGGPVLPEPIGVPFLDVRVLAAAADVPRVTLLLPATTYMENLSAPWAGDRIARDGVVAYPVPTEAPVPWVATADVAVSIERAIEREVTGWYALPGAPLTGLSWRTCSAARSAARCAGRRSRPQVRRPPPPAISATTPPGAPPPSARCSPRLRPAAAQRGPGA